MQANKSNLPKSNYNSLIGVSSFLGVSFDDAVDLLNAYIHKSSAGLSTTIDDLLENEKNRTRRNIDACRDVKLQICVDSQEYVELQTNFCEFNLSVTERFDYSNSNMFHLYRHLLKLSVLDMLKGAGIYDFSGEFWFDLYNNRHNSIYCLPVETNRDEHYYHTQVVYVKDYMHYAREFADVIGMIPVFDFLQWCTTKSRFVTKVDQCRVFNTVEECYVPGVDFAYFDHLRHDIPIEQVATLMLKKGVSVSYGLLCFDDIMFMDHAEGKLPVKNTFCRVNAAENYVDIIVGQNNITKTRHNRNNLIRMVTVNHIKLGKTIFTIELFKRVGCFYVYKMTNIGKPDSDIRSSVLSHGLWKSNADNYCVISGYRFKSEFLDPRLKSSYEKYDFRVFKKNVEEALLFANDLPMHNYSFKDLALFIASGESKHVFRNQEYIRSEHLTADELSEFIIAIYVIAYSRRFDETAIVKFLNGNYKLLDDLVQDTGKISSKLMLKLRVLSTKLSKAIKDNTLGIVDEWWREVVKTTYPDEDLMLPSFSIMPRVRLFSDYININDYRLYDRTVCHTFNDVFGYKNLYLLFNPITAVSNYFSKLLGYENDNDVAWTDMVNKQLIINSNIKPAVVGDNDSNNTGNAHGITGDDINIDNNNKPANDKDTQVLPDTETKNHVSFCKPCQRSSEDAAGVPCNGQYDGHHGGCCLSYDINLISCSHISCDGHCCLKLNGMGQSNNINKISDHSADVTINKQNINTNGGNYNHNEDSKTGEHNLNCNFVNGGTVINDIKLKYDSANINYLNIKPRKVIDDDGDNDVGFRYFGRGSKLQKLLDTIPMCNVTSIVVLHDRTAMRVKKWLKSNNIVKPVIHFPDKPPNNYIGALYLSNCFGNFGQDEVDRCYQSIFSYNEKYHIVTSDYRDQIMLLSDVARDVVERLVKANFAVDNHDTVHHSVDVLPNGFDYDSDIAGRSIPAKTPTVDNPINMMTMVMDKIFPGVRSEDKSYDMHRGEYADMNINVEALKLTVIGSKVKPVTPLRLYKSVINTGVTPSKIQRQKTQLHSVKARNFDVTLNACDQDTDTVVIEAFNRFLEKFCLPAAKTILDYYARTENTINLTKQNLALFVEKLTPEKLEKFLNLPDDELDSSSKCLRNYLMRIKPDGKVNTTGKGWDGILPAQVVIYPESQVNAHWSPLLKIMRDRFISVMDPKCALYILKDRDAIQSHMSHHARGCRKLKYIENDFEKYDKSQHITAVKLKNYVYKRFGLNDIDHDTWEYGSELTHAIAFDTGISFTYCFQMRSGMSDTAIGNTVINAISVAYSYKIKVYIFAVFLGDDSIIAVLIYIDCYDVSHIMISVFNLSTTTIQSEYGFFCSSFIVQVGDGFRFMPDPIKRYEKLGAYTAKSEEKLLSMYESYKDLMKTYAENAFVEKLAECVQSRYNINFNILPLLYGLYTLSVSYDKYRSCFELYETVIY